MDTTYHSAPNPFPHGLREELPYPTAPWLVGQEVLTRLASAPFVGDKRYKRLELQPNDPEAMFVQKYFEHNPPANKGIRRVYVIHTPNLTDGFESELRKCDHGAETFTADWSKEPESDHRDKVHKEWQELADQFTPLEIASFKTVDAVKRACVLPLWHGTSEEVALSVSELGFTFFGKHHHHDQFHNQPGQFESTDPGYFGSGIYFTDSPAYAYNYSELKSDCVLLLSFVAMRTPFPIVANQPHPNKCTDMQRFAGKELYQTYNAHFVPVAPI